MCRHRERKKMRTHNIPVILTLLSGMLLSCSPRPRPAVLRVMSFNIRYDNPGDGRNRWERRRELVSSTIRFHQADIAGLQEVLHNQMEFLRHSLNGFDFVGAGRDDGKEAGEYAPIFYRRDLFEERSWGVFWLSETPDVPGSVGWDAACSRLVTWVRLAERNGGDLFVFNTHFDHVGKRARRESARLLLDRVQELAGDSPVIVTGDFNCAPGDSALRLLIEPDSRPPLLDAYDDPDAIRYGSSGTFNGFRDLAEGNRIDYIFHRNAGRVLAHGIIAEKWDGRFASDHYPVMALFLRSSRD